MSRAASLGLGMLLASGCTEQAPRIVEGIETRVLVDRTEARVGDPVGVTIEIETPEGFAVEPPASPPRNERFFTERVERLEPLAIPGGLRHRLLWTLRARTPGDHPLPDLSVPLAWPDGGIQRLVIGGVPVPVRSVHADLPGRETYFDIRPAPELPGAPLWPWAVGGGLVLAALSGLLLRRTRRGLEPSVPAPASVARETIAAVQAALVESEPADVAARMVEALRALVRARWGIAGSAWTPQELPGDVDAPIASALRALDAERFSGRPSRDAILDVARAVQGHLGNVAGAP